VTATTPVARTPRRSKPSLLSRLRRYWIVATLSLIVLGVAGRSAVGAKIFATGTPSVRGNAHVSSAEVLARAGLDPQANVWLADARSAERRVEAIPYVASARIVRGFPGGAGIVVTERTPDGCVRSEVGLATIDAQQRVLHVGCSGGTLYRVRTFGEFKPGSFLHDAGLARMQNDARELAASGRKLNDFGLDDYGQLEASLPTGIRVRFGDDGDLHAKERLIGPILAALGARLSTVSAIDLRAPGTPVVEHRHQADAGSDVLSTASEDL